MLLAKLCFACTVVYEQLDMIRKIMAETGEFVFLHGVGFGE